MKQGKLIKVILLCAVVVSVLTVGAMAADETSAVVTTMTASFQTIVSDCMSAITGILPVALPLLGLSVAIMFGIKWFKKITGKA